MDKKYCFNRIYGLGQIDDSPRTWAKRLKAEVVATDDLVEAREGKSIDEIFKISW